MTPMPAICAIARSMKTMPRCSTCAPSGTWVASTSRPASRAGSRMCQSMAAGRHRAPFSSRCTVSSNSANRSFACSLPPTVKGSTTIGQFRALGQPLRTPAVVVGRAQDHLRRAGLQAGQHRAQVRAGGLDAGLGFQHRHLLQPQPVLQVRKRLVLHHDRSAAQRRGLLVPALDGRLPAGHEVGAARLVGGGIGRIELGQAARQRLGHERDVARVGLDVRVAGGVHVAVGAVEALRHLEHSHEGRRFEVARLAGLDRAVARLPDQQRQPADLQLGAGADHQVGIARGRDAGWAWPRCGAGPAGPSWRHRR